MPGIPVRSFFSFNEAAVSRLYGRIHYRMAIEEGVAQGRNVGALVVQRVRTRAADTEREGTIAEAVERTSANRAAQ